LNWRYSKAYHSAMAIEYSNNLCTSRTGKVYAKENSMKCVKKE